MQNVGIGIDIGGTTVKMAVFDAAQQLLDQWELATNTRDNGKHLLPEIVETLDMHLATLNVAYTQLRGVGVGVPGNVDEYGQVRGAYNLHWPENYPVRQALINRLHCPVFVENDANLATLGEYSYRSGRPINSMILVTLGTGIGAGMIIDDRLVHGVSGCAGEVGHIIVAPDGLQCTCGNRGCLEAVASAAGIVHLAQSLAIDTELKTPMVSKLVDGDLVTSEVILSTAERGEDAFAMRVAEQLFAYLGQLCAILANTLNPDVIMFGGGMSRAGEFLRAGIEEAYRRQVFAPNRDATTIELAGLQNDAGVKGAMTLVANQVSIDS